MTGKVWDWLELYFGEWFVACIIIPLMFLVALWFGILGSLLITWLLGVLSCS